MEIKTRIKENYFVELQIESGNTKIIEDLSIFKNGKAFVPENEIEQLLTVANECSRFNGTSDVEFVKKIFEMFLSDSERTEFLETIEQNTHTNI